MPAWSVITGSEAVLARVVRGPMPVCEEGDVDVVVEADDEVLACAVYGSQAATQYSPVWPGAP